MIELTPYRQVLRQARPVWMDGTELGMAMSVDDPAHPSGPYPIQLWPYKHARTSGLANTVTEEVVHYVHGPALAVDPPGSPQNIVAADLAKKLMRDSRWQAAVYRWLATHLHWSLKDLYKKSKGRMTVA